MEVNNMRVQLDVGFLRDALGLWSDERDVQMLAACPACPYPDGPFDTVRDLTPDKWLCADHYDPEKHDIIRPNGAGSS